MNIISKLNFTKVDDMKSLLTTNTKQIAVKIILAAVRHKNVVVGRKHDYC